VYYVPLGSNTLAIATKIGTAAPTIQYAYTDYLGSILTVTNSTGAVIVEQNFDAWGRMRNPSTWAYTGIPTNPTWLYRGYTGHEHVTQFGLINMNGRMYDPVVGRMLSVDNHVQAVSSTQSFNRYSYVVNNPLKYTDPTGELVGFAVTWAANFVHGFFSTGNNRGRSGVREANQGVENRWDLIKGLFATDENRRPLGRGFELFSRFTWQLPQTVVGFGYNALLNYSGQVNSVESKYGVTVVDAENEQGAVTIGNFINGPNGFRPDWRDHLFVHEYGHYRQSQRYGLFYFNFVGIPSITDLIVEGIGWPALPGNQHDFRWYEAEAARLGGEYFDEHNGSAITGYDSESAMFFNFNDFRTGATTAYVNPRTNRFNRNRNPTTPNFHWTDVPISFTTGGIFGLIFSIIKY
jgi:RHS repeat-associated protein